MKQLTKNKRLSVTYGEISITLFFYVLVSGILLAIPFDATKPYASITRMMLVHPYASFIRNFHYWSAQLFLIFSLLHLYDHFHKKTEMGLKKGMAFRLSLGVLVIFLAMLTGFLLKGDADSEQARQILQTLLERIPVIGKMLAYSLLGKTGSYGLIYVNHIATLTVFLSVIIVEHSRRFWPGGLAFVFSFVLLVFLSVWFSAPLHDGLHPVVKGPWYFVGFQEVLHWLRHPEWALWGVAVLLLFIYVVNSGKGKMVFFSKRTLLYFSVLYLLLTLTGLFFRGENWQWRMPWQKGYTFEVLQNFRTEKVDFTPAYSLSQAVAAPLIRGRKESCVICHRDVHGLTAAHSPATTGCAACHGGNPLAADKRQAHKQMVLIPGNLATAQRSCGTTGCHPEIVSRVKTGLMATLSGMIRVDRTVFGEKNPVDSLVNVHHLGHTAADEHLRNLCVRCHLGNPKTEPGPVTEKSRGGGCLACHLNYSAKAVKALQILKQPEDLVPVAYAHPSIDLRVSDKHCFGCHSRSGRISTGYAGWHETPMIAAQMPDTIHYRLIEGTRVFKKEPEDIHHKLGMECIDCHQSREIMGDGKVYRHEEDQEDVQCADCHFTGKPHTLKAGALDAEEATIVALRYGKLGEKVFLATRKRNRALVNTLVKNDTSWLVTKASGKRFRLKSPARVCTAPVHKNVSCSACHSAWAPSCIGCHNAYDPNEKGYDMVANKEKKGSWVEYTGDYLAQLPALGFRQTGKKKEIVPVIPGMILTIDLRSYNRKSHDSLLFRRLFAPAAPHTTSVKGRSCKSCHNNPVALGYGQGNLHYVVDGNKGQWVFDALYEKNPHDGLPEDAWTGFLKNRTGMVSTRKNVFPFSVKEQKKILLVGTCLTCHKQKSEVMQKSLYHFDVMLKKRTRQCILPDGE